MHIWFLLLLTCYVSRDKLRVCRVLVFHIRFSPAYSLGEGGRSWLGLRPLFILDLLFYNVNRAKSH